MTLITCIEIVSLIEISLYHLCHVERLIIHLINVNHNHDKLVK